MDGNAELQFDLLSPENIRDPYTGLGRLRERAPVFWSEQLGAWMITGFEDVRAAFRDKRLSADRIRPFIRQNRDKLDAAKLEPLEHLTHWAVFNDPPDHTRLRGLMNKAFTSRAVEALRPNVAEIVNGLIDEIEARPGREFDMVGEFAYPLPATVIADMLGVPRADVGLLKKWSNDLALFVLTSRADPEKYERSAAGIREMTEYFNAFVTEHGTKRSDVTTGLIQASREGDKLTVDEMVASCVLLLFAGHETTAQLLGNGTLALLRFPDQLEDLRANLDDVELVRNTVEEILRYDGPAMSTVRVAAEDFELHGQKIGAGQRVFLMHASANRDPRVFEDPDAFDIRRENASKNIGFGFGIHFCLGAPLARLEGEVAFPILLRRLPDLRLVETDPEWTDSLLTRGMHAMKVAY